MMKIRFSLILLAAIALVAMFFVFDLPGSQPELRDAKPNAGKLFVKL